MNRQQKDQEIDAIGETVRQTPHVFLLDFQGLDVAGATDLRGRLREQNAQLRVVKNRLALRAVSGTPLETIRDAFVGQTALAYTLGDDAVALAKVLRDFAADHNVPRFKAGFVHGQAIGAEEFRELADLPSREQLIAKVAYLMQYPVSGLVTVMGGVLRGFVIVLERIRVQREGGDER